MFSESSLYIGYISPRLFFVVVIFNFTLLKIDSIECVTLNASLSCLNKVLVYILDLSVMVV